MFLPLIVNVLAYKVRNFPFYRIPVIYRAVPPITLDLLYIHYVLFTLIARICLNLSNLVIITTVSIVHSALEYAMDLTAIRH